MASRRNDPSRVSAVEPPAGHRDVEFSPSTRRELYAKRDESAVLRALGPHTFRHPKEVAKVMPRPIPYQDLLQALRRLGKAGLVMRGPLPRTGFGWRLTAEGLKRHAELLEEKQQPAKGRTARRRRKRQGQNAGPSPTR